MTMAEPVRSYGVHGRVKMWRASPNFEMVSPARKIPNVRAARAQLAPAVVIWIGPPYTPGCGSRSRRMIVAEAGQAV